MIKENELLSIINKDYKNDLYLENIQFISSKPNSIEKEEIKKAKLNKAFSLTCLFARCSSLKYLPDISKWDIKNSTDISIMFAGCTSLLSLPDISKWNTENIKDMYSLFTNCSSLKSLPDISKWDIKNVKDISLMLMFGNAHL